MNISEIEPPQQQTVDVKKCKKQARWLLGKYPALYCLILFLPYIILLHLSFFSLFALTGSIWNMIEFIIPVSLVLLYLYALFFVSLFYALFPLEFKSGRRIHSWGREQDIYPAICREFLDRAHPPKKTAQLWTTPHFLIFAPYSFTPKIYYLPALTSRESKPGGKDILHFSDGEKLYFKKIRKKSRTLLEEAIADYF